MIKNNYPSQKTVEAKNAFAVLQNRSQSGTMDIFV